MPPRTPTDYARLDQLNGLRGATAVVVVTFHLLCSFAPSLVPQYSSDPAWIARTPIGIFWNGPLAVYVFFVLTGVTLTISARRRPVRLVLDIAIRYLRLGIPAGLSVMVAWVFLSFFPTAAQELRSVTGSEWLRWTYQAPIPGPAAAAYDGFISVFLWGGSFFNNVLWTMRPELIGSAMCYAIASCKSDHVRTAGIAAFALLAGILWRSEYLGFLLGILLIEGRSLLSGPKWVAMAPWLFLLGLALSLQGAVAGQPGASDFALPFAAAMIVHGCIESASIQRAFSAPVLQFMGDISFPFYLLHVPMIYTVLATVSLPFAQGSTVILLAIVAIWLAGLIGLSYLAARFLERPFINQLRRLQALPPGRWRGRVPTRAP